MTKQETTYVLELTEAEAQYVHAALSGVKPAYDQFGKDGDDPVYDVLSDTLLEHDLGAAKRG